MSGSGAEALYTCAQHFACRHVHAHAQPLTVLFRESTPCGGGAAPFRCTLCFVLVVRGPRVLRFSEASHVLTVNAP